MNGIFNCEAGGDWEYEVLGLGSSGELDQIGKNVAREVRYEKYHKIQIYKSQYSFINHSNNFKKNKNPTV